jgi:selenocysteine-specific elongation factor
MGAPSGEIASVVIGTAGHIDHGKSSMVRRLTGVDPDRLKEEKDRELTIDLGFAPLQLPDGRTVGLIDVPGHERFVKNMVAGATGIDLVLLVVAADDGIMPQTREHLEILTLLGLRRGIVVITKIDLPGIDPEWLELQELEIRELLEPTFLAEAPLVRISSATGEGIDALREQIVAQVAQTEPRDEAGAFRMPIQRVFSARGFGTILTGVPLTGTVGAGDQVEVLTGRGDPFKGKIRGLQAYGQKVDRVRAGHSSALNVNDVDRKQVRRGDVVATPGIFSASALWEVRLTHLASQRRPLRQRETVRFHVGTSEVIGEVVILEQKTLEPGQSGLCQVRLREPVVAAAGDRFVARRHSPMETLGGGVLLGASKWRLKPFKGFVLERLGSKEAALDQAEESLLIELRETTGSATQRTTPQPARASDLVKRLQVPQKEIEAQLTDLAATGRIVEVSAGKGQPIYVARDDFQATAERLQSHLRAFHTAHPFREACPKKELRTQLRDQRGKAIHDGLLATVLEHLSNEEQVRTLEQGYALTEHEVRLTPSAEALASGLTELYQQAAFQPPTWAQAQETLEPKLAAAAAAAGEAGEAEGADATPLSPDQAQDVFLHLQETHQLVSIGEDIVFHADRYREAKDLVRREIKKTGPLAAATFKDLLDSTRRYTIPLLEHFDEVGLTRREGDVRVLREP